MASSLAVKYRPKSFEETLGQSSTIKILERQLELGKLSHCYLFAGASGAGKAQPLTSNVLTLNGFKQMGDIKVGDKIIDGNGEETSVLGVFPQGVRPIYKISFDDGTSIEVADNHLNSVYRYDSISRTYKELVLNTLELKEYLDKKNSKYGPSICVKIPKISCWKTSDKCSIDPYLLGCLLGDGSISDTRLAFTSTDTEILDRLNSILERDYSMTLKHVAQNDYGIVSKESYKYHFKYKDVDYFTPIDLQNRLIADGYPKFDPATIIRLAKGEAKHYNSKYPELKENLKLLEVTNKTVWNTHGLKKELRDFGLNTSAEFKHIPSCYLNSSYETRLALLQGLMDTDGTAEKSFKSIFSGKDIGGSCYLSTCSKQLADDTAYLARSLGFRVSVKVRKNRKYKYRYKDVEEYRPCKDAYVIYIRADSDSNLFQLSRKIKRTCPKRFEPRKKILSIEYVRDDECQCIYVESGCHEYITDGFTVTHNTTLARIFAMEINNHKGSPIEIDAASNNGVDAIRAIVDSARERAVDSEYKIFIIDECHSISSQGWQAFLKCIEEPPEYTIFMFCTTNPEKVPETIQNRVMRLNISKVDTRLIAERLKFICKQEGFTNYDEACDYLSKLGNGGVRDSIAYLEKCANYNPDLSINNVLECLGNFSYDSFFNLTGALLNGDEAEVLSMVEDYYNSGNDLKMFIENFLEFSLDLAKYCLFKSMSVIKIPSSLESRCIGYSNIPDILDYTNNLVSKLLDIKNAIRQDINPKNTVEVMLINICRGV